MTKELIEYLRVDLVEALRDTTDIALLNQELHAEIEQIKAQCDALAKALHGWVIGSTPGAQPVPYAAIHKVYADLAFDALKEKPSTYYRSLKLIMDKAMLEAAKDKP